MKYGIRTTKALLAALGLLLSSCNYLDLKNENNRLQQRVDSLQNALLDCRGNPYGKHSCAPLIVKKTADIYPGEAYVAEISLVDYVPHNQLILAHGQPQTSSVNWNHYVLTDTIAPKGNKGYEVRFKPLEKQGRYYWGAVIVHCKANGDTMRYPIKESFDVFKPEYLMK